MRKLTLVSRSALTFVYLTDKNEIYHRHGSYVDLICSVTWVHSCGCSSDLVGQEGSKTLSQKDVRGHFARTLTQPKQKFMRRIYHKTISTKQTKNFFISKDSQGILFLRH